jgi:hypothetical protein
MKLYGPTVSNLHVILDLSSPYLSSGPPSLRTMFRRENIVPNMSFASSFALSRAGRDLAGPESVIIGLLLLLEPEIGLPCAPPEDVGRSCAAQSLV